MGEISLGKAVSIATGLVGLIAALWVTFETVATKADVEEVKNHVLEEQHSLAGVQAKTHVMDYLELRIIYTLDEIEDLEEKEAEEGLTRSEENRLQKLTEDLREFEQLDRKTRKELMDGMSSG